MGAALRSGGTLRERSGNEVCAGSSLTAWADAPVVGRFARAGRASTDRLVSAFYAPTVLWVDYPALTLLPPAVFALAYVRLWRRGRRSPGLGLAGVSWSAYSVYELGMYVWSRTRVAPIRIELIVLGPLMYGITLLGIVSWCRASSRRTRGRVT